MVKRKKSSDLNVIAFEVLQAATGQSQDKSTKKHPPAKNPAAVALGRLGGLKGGKARAKKLSPELRSKIARKAANERWKSG